MGVLGALLRDLLDTRIRGRAEVESVTDRPVLGIVPRSKDLEDAPVFIQGNLRSAFAESFRALRTNLRFLGSTGTGRLFVITSANANEGKTTTAVNLAAALMEGGARVAIIRLLDLRRPAVATRLDLENNAGLTDVLIGRAELEDIVAWGATGQVLLAGPVPFRTLRISSHRPA